MRVVPRRTAVGDIDRRYRQVSSSHVNCVSSVYGIYVSGQLSRDVIGCWFVKSCCYRTWNNRARRLYMKYDRSLSGVVESSLTTNVFP